MAFWSAVLAGGFAGLATGMVLHILFSWTPLGMRVNRELNTHKGIRPMADLRMGLYLPFISPFVNALLTALAFLYFRDAVDVASFESPWMAGVQFGLVLWAIGPAHGILIDWCMYKISLDVTVMFEVSTFVSAAATGAAVVFLLAGAV